MRNALIAALLLGCACSGAPDAAPAPVEEPMPSADLCFRVDDPLLREAFDFDAAAVEAAEAWGKTMVLDDRCESKFGVDDLVSSKPGKTAAAMEFTGIRDGVEVPAGVPGGVSHIIFNRTSILNGLVADMTPDECIAAQESTGVAHPLLRHILTHELGHALGLRDSAESGAMFGHGSPCVLSVPTQAEIDAAM